MRREVEPAGEARRVERDDEAADDVAAEHLDDEAQQRVEPEVGDEQRPGLPADARAQHEQRVKIDSSPTAS